MFQHLLWRYLSFLIYMFPVKFTNLKAMLLKLMQIHYYKYWMIYGLPLITIFVVTSGEIHEQFSRLTQSRVKIIVESLHEPLYHFISCMIFGCWNRDKSMKTPIDRLPLLFVVLWCQKTPIVTSFWPIVLRTFLCGSRAFSCRRRVDYHSLIIEHYSRRFHWLTCKKLRNIILQLSSFLTSEHSIKW